MQLKNKIIWCILPPDNGLHNRMQIIILKDSAFGISRGYCRANLVSGVKKSMGHKW